jgi:hypothetical protein
MLKNHRLLFVLFCFFNLSFSSVCQNLSYKLFTDSIFPIAESDYLKSKKIYVENQKKYCYDPSNIHSFLRFSLGNADIEFFKKESAKLMDLGFRFQYSDTSIVNRNNDSFYELINQYKLIDWLVKETLERFPIYWRKHPELIDYEVFKNTILAKDQLVIRYSNELKKQFPKVLTKNQNVDSVLIGDIDSILKEAYMKLDFDNILDIDELCRKNNNQLPTNFDCPFLSRYIELSYFHVMKNSAGKNLIQTWDLLHNYFEEAYIKGVVNDAFFSTYDHYLEVYFGKQYYGTRPINIPLLDPENYQERKNRLGL